MLEEFINLSERDKKDGKENRSREKAETFPSSLAAEQKFGPKFTHAHTHAVTISSQLVLKSTSESKGTRIFLLFKIIYLFP